MQEVIIQKGSITDMAVDAIVNAANQHLQGGGGVCGAIFSAAGYARMQSACDQIGFCETGSAVVTPGFDLPARYVIHAVGPVWRGGGEGEAIRLYGAYESALRLALEKGCHSIAFPLISAGIYGYPRAEAWRVALEACYDFLELHPDTDLKIIFAVISDGVRLEGEEQLEAYRGGNA